MGQSRNTPTELEQTAIIEFRAELEALERTKGEISLVFLTNIRRGDLRQVNENGIDNSAQHYTEAQASKIISAFQSAGFHVVTYFSEADFMADALSGELKAKCKKIPIVFTAAEGGNGPGRRALVPAFCQMNGIAYCNSSPHGCSVARHKYHANAILKSVGLPVPDAWMMRPDGKWIGGQQPQSGTKVIVKPMYESMALGIDEGSVRIVDETFNEFVRARACRFGQPITAQQFISGYEIGVPILDLSTATALPIIAFTYENNPRYGMKPRTFDDENLSTKVGLKSFDEFPIAQYLNIQRSAINAFQALDMAGMGRIDMRVDEDGRPWIFDTNESPPPLEGTSYTYAMSLLGFSLPETLSLWVATGLKRSSNSHSLGI